MFFLLLLFGILPVYSTLRFGKAIVHYKEHISGSQPPWAKTDLFSARNGKCGKDGILKSAVFPISIEQLSGPAACKK